MVQVILSFVIGYLSGSIPFGLLFTKAAGLGDVRNIGSGNIGATNVLRTGNKKIAALTLLCDALKGTVPVLVAGALTADPRCAIIAGFGALIGHMFPVWLGFKGGKGVATLIGVLFGLYWPLGLCFLVLWLAAATALRISSASALLASALIPVIAWALGRSDLVVPVALMVAMVWIAHRENIQRLLKGTESRIDLKRRG